MALSRCVGVGSARDSERHHGPAYQRPHSPTSFSHRSCHLVYADAQSRGKSLCYDYDTFAFFAWPLVVPYYLFQTRGARALLTMLYFGCLCVAAALFGLGVYGLLWILNR